MILLGEFYGAFLPHDSLMKLKIVLWTRGILPFMNIPRTSAIWALQHAACGGAFAATHCTLANLNWIDSDKRFPASSTAAAATSMVRRGPVAMVMHRIACKCEI
ncbi:hypothetical protein L596_011637 [Steinernema carpocapsae]|uniref:Uncharacterized protein n=1 Tax=Steinernema carpocapsae TaxID=34508 RepID=A0A4U5NVE6_STECR|nr:hypothetical protein L596_011637 [Steinernema carpocapsae]